MLYPSVTCTAAIASELQGSGTPYFQNSVVQDKRLAQQVLALCLTLEQPQELLVQQTRFVEVLSTLLNRYARINSRLLEDRQEHRAVRLIKDYLHDNFRASISLAQLAEVTNLNCSYLVRVFRDAVGMPPYTYLNQIRVEKAKQCLRQGMAIAETAIAVGMTDQSHLNRHFKRIVGISPGQYRTMSTSFKTEQA
jgi:AraC-like DNA-binding protein